MDTIVALEYQYEIVVTSVDNVQSKFSGKVCCLPCQNQLNLFRPDSIGNCAFPNQYDPFNGFDATIDSGESLDCFLN